MIEVSKDMGESGSGRQNLQMDAYVVSRELPCNRHNPDLLGPSTGFRCGSRPPAWEVSSDDDPPLKHLTKMNLRG